jgi:hypothetical protein
MTSCGGGRLGAASHHALSPTAVASSGGIRRQRVRRFARDGRGPRVRVARGIGLSRVFTLAGDGDRLACVRPGSSAVERRERVVADEGHVAFGAHVPVAAYSDAIRCTTRQPALPQAAACGTKIV